MSSDVTYIKGGIKIQCDTSLFPAPRPQTAFPVPSFPSVQTSLLALALVAVANQAASGIQVTPAGTLPGGSTATWVLYHQAYQGAPAKLPAPEAIPRASRRSPSPHCWCQPRGIAAGRSLKRCL